MKNIIILIKTVSWFKEFLDIKKEIEEKIIQQENENNEKKKE